MTVRTSTIRVVGVTLGGLSIFFGGLVAAVTGPMAIDKGNWLAAYLVLVAGLAQVLLSGQQIILEARETVPQKELTKLMCSVGGNIAVISGTFSDSPLVVDLGGFALSVGLIIALIQTDGAQRVPLAWLARVFYILVLISIPVGLLLAHLQVD